MGEAAARRLVRPELQSRVAQRLFEGIHAVGDDGAAKTEVVLRNGVRDAVALALDFLAAYQARVARRTVRLPVPHPMSRTRWPDARAICSSSALRTVSAPDS